MFKDQLFDEIDQHRVGGEPAALAMVVRRDAPSSGKPGDKAIVTTDGEVKGWVGGGCTKGIVIKEALEAIREQAPRLVRIQPEDQAMDKPGVKNYRMTCMSGGSVEVYIEPIAQISQVQIFGRSHIAMALSQIATAAGFRVNVVSDLAEEEMFPSAMTVSKLSDYREGQVSSSDFVVVCTQGEDDEKSVLKAIEANPRYLGFVSSRKKANSIFLSLKRQGIEHKELARIKTPAGLDINAKPRRRWPSLYWQRSSS